MWIELCDEVSINSDYVSSVDYIEAYDDEWQVRVYIPNESGSPRTSRSFRSESEVLREYERILNLLLPDKGFSGQCRC